MLWDVDFQTAVAQAELEDRERPAALHRLASPATRRAGRDRDHPARAAGRRASPWWRSPTTTAYRRAGRHDGPVPAVRGRGAGAGPSPRRPREGHRDRHGLHVRRHHRRRLVARARPAHARRRRAGRPPRRRHPGVAGRRTGRGPPTPSSPEGGSTRRGGAMVELLAASGEMASANPGRSPTRSSSTRRATSPLEIVTSRQWYLRNGGRDPALRAELRRRGDELAWVPDFMRVRYEHWVDGLTGDWLVSRQRFFGVPFPVWYPVDDDGTPDHDHPIVADESTCPIDPASDVPPGYARVAAGPSRAASSPTPTSWTPGPRPRSRRRSSAGGRTTPTCSPGPSPWTCAPRRHEIIRTWLFASVVRAHCEHGALPWPDAAISGWVARPRPQEDVASRRATWSPRWTCSTGTARTLSATGRPGAGPAPTPPSTRAQMKVGRRLAIKLLNASQFVLGLGDRRAASADGPVTEPLDRSMLARLADVGRRGHRRASTPTTTPGRSSAPSRFFWAFCDDYLELVKGRAYGDGAARPRRALGPRRPAPRPCRPSCGCSLRSCPSSTEEVWSWWQEGSIHRPGGRRWSHHR